MINIQSIQQLHCSRVSIVRWNLKEAVSKTPVRRTEITYKASRKNNTHILYHHLHTVKIFPTFWTFH